ncbi:hypothetical protein [Actinomadura sp. KC216]|nr:hypothetical protein [Actinomadura sp. KC216]
MKVSNGKRHSGEVIIGCVFMGLVALTLINTLAIILIAILAL